MSGRDEWVDLSYYDGLDVVDEFDDEPARTESDAKSDDVLGVFLPGGESLYLDLVRDVDQVVVMQGWSTGRPVGQRLVRVPARPA